MSKKIFITVLILIMAIGNSLCYYYNNRPLATSTNLLLGFLILMFAIKNEKK